MKNHEKRQQATGNGQRVCGGLFHLLSVFAAIAFLAIVPQAAAQTIEELEKQVQDGSASAKAREALAEGYLRDCQLEKSLRLWQEILKQQPDHARAKLVVVRLTAQALDLDTQLETLGTLIDRGVFKGTDSLLDAASQRAATDTQKSHILYLRGRLALRDAAAPSPVIAPAPPAPEPIVIEEEDAEPASQPAPEKKLRRVVRPTPVPKAIAPPPAVVVPLDSGQEASARTLLEGAMKVAPDSVWAARSAMVLARLEVQNGRRDAAMRLLRQVTDNKKLEDVAVKQTAKFRLVMLESQDLTAPEQIAALQELLGVTTAAEARRLVLEQLVLMTTAASGKWGPQAVDYLALMLKASASYEESAAVMGRLAEVAAGSQDPSTLDRLLAVLKDVKSDDPALARQGQFLTVEAMLARAVAEDKLPAVAALVAQSQKMLDSIADDTTTPKPNDGLRVPPAFFPA